MKKLFLFVCIVALTVSTNAQVKTPAPSPAQKIEQTVGLTDVTLEYSRPSMRERTIFGELVPYGKLWRTGANKNTMITFSDAVEIGGKTVEAGTYAIFTKPSAEQWEVYFYSDSNNWGTPQKWDDTKVAAKVKAQVMAMPMDIQSFTMTFDDVTRDSAHLGMLWENVYVGVPLKFNTDTAVSASIDKVMGGPGANDYYQSAVYYLESGKDLNKAKEWINTAIEKRADAFWYYRQKSLIYAKSGDKKGAIAAAEKSMAMADKAGNAAYVALNKKSLAEWKNMK
ncbi:MAG: DUF2911 domain-containing protein [Flavobacteriaceae bacterium]|nr:DUF2911 domain-containing protein [Flavobacteriaceae bacterium]